MGQALCLGAKHKQMQFEYKAGCEKGCEGGKGASEEAASLSTAPSALSRCSGPHPSKLSMGLRGPIGMGSFGFKVTPRQK